MDGIICIGVLVAAVLITAAAKKNPQELIEPDVDAEDVREGVQNGWYTCQLTTKDGVPAVILSGRMTNGENYTGVFTISERDWKSLQKEGYEAIS